MCSMQFSVYINHDVVCSVFCAMCSEQCAVFRLHGLVCIVKCKVSTVQCAVKSVQVAVSSEVYIVRCAQCCVHSALCSVHSTFCSVRCTLCTVHFATLQWAWHVPWVQTDSEIICDISCALQLQNMHWRDRSLAQETAIPCIVVQWSAIQNSPVQFNNVKEAAKQENAI